MVCINVLYNESLKNRSAFRTGGAADKAVFPSTEKELTEAVDEYGSARVFGNLSNTLVTDAGVSGGIIITTDMKGISVNNTEITAACGEALSSLALFALKNSLTGLEFAYGIPGTAGGAVYMNAGAYGGEMKDIVSSVRLYSPETGIVTLTCPEMRFGYRKSILCEKNFAVLSVTLSLTHGNADEIKAKMDGFMAARRAKQPLEYPSCGSTFKRPEGFFAGKLIEDCGLKGVSVGGAQVSEKHAGFVINRGGATSEDILALITLVKKTVLENTGVALEEEIRIIGDGV